MSAIPRIRGSQRPLRAAPAQIFAGRYVLRRELGRGGMGAVYAAFDLREWRQVALKKIEPQSGQASLMFEERFEREVRALAGIKHAGIPTLYASGRSPEGAAFYTMEIIAGERLRTLLEGGALEPVRALTIAIELGRALAAAHEAGVVHRDVKPGNILIEPGGRVRVIDFGACSFLPHFFTREEIGDERITATHDRWATSDLDVVATPGYSAPEISRRDEEATVRADIYSVCAIAYEMIQGRPLFDRQMHCDRVIRPEEFAPHLAPLAEILAHGAAHETHERQKSMFELVQALEIMRTMVSRAGMVDRPIPVSLPRSRRSWWFSGGMAVVAVVLLAIAWYGEPWPPGDEGVADAAGSRESSEPASPSVLAASERADADQPASPSILAASERADPEQPPTPALAEPAVATRIDQAPLESSLEAEPGGKRSARVGPLRTSGRSRLPDAKLVSRVRACDPGRPPRVSLTVQDGRARIVNINLSRFDAKSSIHRCVRDALNVADFPRNEQAIRRTIQ